MTQASTTTSSGGKNSTNHQQQGGDARARHVIICGFGLSGRSCANALLEQGVSICVIEKNPETVARCQKGGLQIMSGDATDPEVLRQAGIERATEIAIAVPDDDEGLRIIDTARSLSQSVHIIARCTFVSGGFEAHRRGANEIVVAEQVVATEFGRVVRDFIPR